VGDTRIFQDSDYFLPSEFVDRFAGEVHAAANTQEDILIETSNGDDDGELDGVGNGCNAHQWKAAGEKGTWGIFDETGIFASCCQHGLILWIVDMIRSGEL
jgi:hypothetical protein